MHGSAITITDIAVLKLLDTDINKYFRLQRYLYHIRDTAIYIDIFSAFQMCFLDNRITALRI